MKCEWPKICSCGKKYDPNEWEKLNYVGIMNGLDDVDLELRNCTCGSTISQPMTITVDEILMDL